jgi:hypothetical protein
LQSTGEFRLIVAIKVLPESAVADATRLRRFETEARAAGALAYGWHRALSDLFLVEGLS